MVHDLRRPVAMKSDETGALVIDRQADGIGQRIAGNRAVTAANQPGNGLVPGQRIENDVHHECS